MTDSRNIPMTIFSANTMFIATLIEQGKPIMGYGKKLPLGKIFAVTNGVITGFFDKNGNPDKAYLDVAGTAFKNFIKFLFILNCNYIFIKK